jgi:GNAT superfamily N-acetyltransferase
VLLHDVAYLSDLFQVDAAEMVGPSYQGYVEARDFRPDRRRPVRALLTSDRPLLEALLAACSPKERSDSGIDPDRPLSIGSFADGHLVSVAQSRELSPDAGDPCVLTHPRHRGAGHGTAVVSAVVEQGLGRDALVLYQTLLSNNAATRLAQRLGFRRFASHVAIPRL